MTRSEQSNFADELRASHCRQLASKRARSPLADDDACEALARDLGDESDAAVRHAIELSARTRDTYLDDRAFRLLNAVANSTPVPPIEPRSAEGFGRQRDLGRSPLRDAFAHLATLEPALHALDPATPGYTSAIEAIPALVGPEARGGDPLLQTSLAWQVVMLYLDAVEDDEEEARNVLLARPVFDHRSPGSVSSLFVGPPRPDLDE